MMINLVIVKYKLLVLVCFVLVIINPDVHPIWKGVFYGFPLGSLVFDLGLAVKEFLEGGCES